MRSTLGTPVLRVGDGINAHRAKRLVSGMDFLHTGEQALLLFKSSQHLPLGDLVLITETRLLVLQASGSGVDLSWSIDRAEVLGVERSRHSLTVRATGDRHVALKRMNPDDIQMSAYLLSQPVSEPSGEPSHQPVFTQVETEPPPATAAPAVDTAMNKQQEPSDTAVGEESSEEESRHEQPADDREIDAATPDEVVSGQDQPAKEPQPEPAPTPPRAARGPEPEAGPAARPRSSGHNTAPMAAHLAHISDRFAQARKEPAAPTATSVSTATRTAVERTVSASSVAVSATNLTRNAEAAPTSEEHHKIAEQRTRVPAPQPTKRVPPGPVPSALTSAAQGADRLEAALQRAAGLEASMKRTVEMAAERAAEPTKPKVEKPKSDVGLIEELTVGEPQDTDATSAPTSAWSSSPKLASLAMSKARRAHDFVSLPVQIADSGSVEDAAQSEAADTSNNDEPDPGEGAAATIEEKLLDESAALSPAEFLAQETPPEVSGLSSWWVDASGAAELSRGLGLTLEPGLLYAGEAGATNARTGRRSDATLWSRVTHDHLGNNTSPSTLRRSLEAVLSASRSGSDLTDVDLTAWMHEHLRVECVPFEDHVELGKIAADTLKRLDAPFNIRQMEPSQIRAAVARLRKHTAHH